MLKSHETNKETEESKDSSESPQKEEERRRSPTPPPARNSPEPSCAICLEQLQNKSFTDSCFHMFCFTCLVEWSKVKPECPLCKKSFKSIVHNVRSFKDYDQYYISKSRISENLWQCVAERRFRYNTTLTSDRILGRRQIDYSDRLENEIASHRMRYAPHSVHSVRMYPSAQTARRIPCAFRRRIYEQNLWVRPSPSNRVRLISPTFFRQNIACTHRLFLWLSRELLVVMPNNESQVSFVIELIMALIVKYEITSQEFYTLIEPYTASYTAHFIHEFYNFAVSPYEAMQTYDLHAQYSTPFEEVQGISSPDSDVIPLPMSESSSQKSSSSQSVKRKKQHHSTKKKHSKESKKLDKMILKRNTENNCWESIISPVPFVDYMDASSSMPFELARPSTSRGNPFQECSTEMSNLELDHTSEVECLAGKEDDECQVVEVLKPKSERTPEIVDLSSDEELPKFIESARIVEDENDSEKFTTIFDNQPISFSTTDDDDDDIIIVSESETNPKTDNVPDIPIDYSLKSSEKTVESEANNQKIEPCTSSNKENSEAEASELKKNTVLQSAVQALTNDDTRSSSWSPLLRPKKRKPVILDDVSTESCSDSTQISEVDSRVKKLKLRRVVAHFSFDPSDEHDSSHHSSVHKKHKERKKKKKKHKHKCRIYSSDSDH